MDSKDIYIFTKKVIFKQNAVFMNILFIKESWITVFCGFHKYIKV